MKEKTLLSIENLSIDFVMESGTVSALRGMNVDIYPGSIHGLVGESGSGKTVAARAVMGLNPMPPGLIRGGSILFRGDDLLKKSLSKLRKIRGKEIGMIFQEPTNYLNPAMQAGLQIAEQLMYHENLSKKQALEKTREVLREVELGRNDRILSSYPHELSGGMKQRVMIAMAVACRPKLLLADEPTTALDVTIQKQILDLLVKLRDEWNIAILFVSHDLAVVHSIADTVSVIYAGEIVEQGKRDDIFHDPRHPYTIGLLNSVPTPSHRGHKLDAVKGTIHDPYHVPSGCPFHPRCPIAVDVCSRERPAVRYVSGQHSCSCHRVEGKSFNGTPIYEAHIHGAPIHEAPVHGAFTGEPRNA
ncbi:MAG: ABC transporter ATP-binding protein [Spirochaetia bacterium]|nr:ABC transporter ATP-binding protein [Spirochaetia bacterium]